MRFWLELNPNSRCRSSKWVHVLIQSGVRYSEQAFYFIYDLSLSLSLWTDWNKHLWASGHFLCWCICNLHDQWPAPSAGENCHRQKGTFKRPCRMFTWMFFFLLLYHTSLHISVLIMVYFLLLPTHWRFYMKLMKLCFISLSGTHPFCTNYRPATEVSKLWWNTDRWRFYHQIWREQRKESWERSGQLLT